MIAAALSIAMQAPKDRIIEVPGDPSRTVIEVVVPLPELDPYQRRIGRITAATVGLGSEGFSRGSAIDATLGEGVTANIIGDTLRFGIESESGDPRMAILILADAILKPRFDSESIERAGSLGVGDDGLMRSVEGTAVDTTPPTRARVLDFWRRYVTPGTMSVAIMGGFASGTPTRLWREAMREYRRPDLRYEPVSTARSQRNAGWVVRVGASRAWSAQGPARLLAAFALGAGKGSSIFRSLRRDSGISYRQEFFWLPAAKGWRPVLAYRSSASADVQREALEALLKAVDAWTEADRARALAMARQSYLAPAVWDPLTLAHVETGMTPSAIDAWRFAAWPVLSGAEWNPNQILNQLEGIDLDQMKAEAKLELGVKGGN